jgi:hypothetical protein
LHNEAKTELITEIISRNNYKDDDFIHDHDQCSCISEIEFLHEPVDDFEIFVFSGEQ